MRELYSLTGPYFTLPAWITFPDEGGLVGQVNVGAGIHLMEIQHAAAQEWLTTIGAFRERGRWWAPDKVIGQHFERCEDQDVNPEMLVEWRPWQRTVKYRKVKREPMADAVHAEDEFFHEFAKLGWLPGPLQTRAMEARVIWQAFLQHAMHWLLNEQRPVDFLFFTLHALPVRKNWKEIACSEWITITKSRKGKMPLGLKPYQNRVTWTSRCLLAPQMTAINPKTRRITWTLEAVANPAWDEFCLKYERHRGYGHSPLPAYAVGVRTRLSQKQQELSLIYADYLSRIRLPYLQLGPKFAFRAALSPFAKGPAGETHYLRPPTGLVAAYDYWSRQEVPPVEPIDGGSEAGAVPEVPLV